jgi:hypothetical protein
MVFDLLNITRDTLLQPLGFLKYSHSFVFELIDIVIMALAIGYIFSGYLKKPADDNYDPLRNYKRKDVLWEDIKYAALAAGPAVILHELAHKFVAIAFGAQATLYAPYGFYLIVILLKLIGFPFLFFVGGMVYHTSLSALPSALVALAGPFTNFLIWFSLTILMNKNKIKSKYYIYTVPLAKISLFLAIFNMIPLPGFDGFSFFASLFQFFFA